MVLAVLVVQVLLLPPTLSWRTAAMKGKGTPMKAGAGGAMRVPRPPQKRENQNTTSSRAKFRVRRGSHSHGRR